MRVILILFLFSLSHCGYNWGHETRELPGGHKTVYVEMFKNQTKELGLESQFQKALANELQRSGFAIVTNRNQAEVIIKGDVLAASVMGTASESSFKSRDFSNSDPTLRTTRNFQAPFFITYNLKMMANVRAIRSRDKQLIWQSTLSGSQTFQSARLRAEGLRSSNVLYNEARKKETIKLVAKEMMSDAFDRLTENF